MIDAASFASSYNAFWQSHTPMCEHFVRRLNLEGLERFCPPMPDSNTNNRAYIAEYAFSLFVEHMNDRLTGERRTPNQIDDRAKAETNLRLASYGIVGLSVLRSLDTEETREVTLITQALLQFFSDKLDGLVLRPRFKGCGFVDSSEGDVLYREAIFEIKTVDRRLRSKDIRQLLTYSALNMASGQFSVRDIGLVNPRKGQFFILPLDEVCPRISGVATPDLLSVIVDALSTGGISK